MTVIPRRLADELCLEPTGKVMVETDADRIELEKTRIWIGIEAEKRLCQH